MSGGALRARLAGIPSEGRGGRALKAWFSASAAIILALNHQCAISVPVVMREKALCSVSPKPPSGPTSSITGPSRPAAAGGIPSLEARRGNAAMKFFFLATAGATRCKCSIGGSRWKQMEGPGGVFLGPDCLPSARDRSSVAYLETPDPQPRPMLLSAPGAGRRSRRPGAQLEVGETGKVIAGR